MHLIRRLKQGNVGVKRTHYPNPNRIMCCEISDPTRPEGQPDSQQTFEDAVLRNTFSSNKMLRSDMNISYMVTE
jgi:hypothetical protein